uniref:Uncharacterized protein n=1 Tax=Octopus bimaculoides TaxID=37653 RepID=A0A0L8GEK7_OCTBM
MRKAVINNKSNVVASVCSIKKITIKNKLKCSNLGDLSLFICPLTFLLFYLYSFYCSGLYVASKLLRCSMFNSCNL